MINNRPSAESVTVQYCITYSEGFAFVMLFSLLQLYCTVHMIVSWHKICCIRTLFLSNSMYYVRNMCCAHPTVSNGLLLYLRSSKPATDTRCGINDLELLSGSYVACRFYFIFDRIYSKLRSYCGYFFLNFFKMFLMLI
jgi:hypothetical protein